MSIVSKREWVVYQGNLGKIMKGIRKELHVVDVLEIYF